MTNRTQQDLVWKALADPTRRDMLDALAAGPLSTGDLVEQFDSLCRTNVMKHLDVLVQANLVVIRREGRTRWNYLNPVPIQRICDRWVSKHVKKMASALSHLKDHVEAGDVRSGDAAAHDRGADGAEAATDSKATTATSGKASTSKASPKSRKRASNETKSATTTSTKTSRKAASRKQRARNTNTS